MKIDHSICPLDDDWLGHWPSDLGRHLLSGEVDDDDYDDHDDDDDDEVDADGDEVDDGDVDGKIFSQKTILEYDSCGKKIV